MNTLILSGVHIGDGAIVKACSVVTKDVEPYTVSRGKPRKSDQKTIRSRNHRQISTNQMVELEHPENKG